MDGTLKPAGTLLLAALVVLAGISPVQAIESQRMRATGYGEMRAGDMAGAREVALDAALRAAVEAASVRAFGTARVGSDPVVFRKRVLDRSRDYVDGYQVLDEGVEDGSGGMRYRVVLEVEVALALVEEVVAPPPEPPPSESVMPPSGMRPTEVVPVGPRPSVELDVTGDLTGVRYRALMDFLEHEVPGVERVLPTALAMGQVTLRVSGSFPPEDLGGYLASANLPGFRLRLSVVPRSSPFDPERLLVRVEAGPGSWR